jgi:hypothetical protein
MNKWVEAKNTCHICGSPIRVKFAAIKGIPVKSILNDLQLCPDAECDKCSSISAWKRYSPSALKEQVKE